MILRFDISPESPRVRRRTWGDAVPAAIRFTDRDSSKTARCHGDRRDGRRVSFPEGVLDQDAAELLAMLQVFCQQPIATSAPRRLDDHRVPDREVVAASGSDGAANELGVGGDDWKLGQAVDDL